MAAATGAPVARPWLRVTLAVLLPRCRHLPPPRAPGGRGCSAETGLPRACTQPPARGEGPGRPGVRGDRRRQWGPLLAGAPRGPPFPLLQPRLQTGRVHPPSRHRPHRDTGHSGFGVTLALRSRAQAGSEAGRVPSLQVTFSWPRLPEGQLSAGPECSPQTSGPSMACGPCSRQAPRPLTRAVCVCPRCAHAHVPATSWGRGLSLVSASDGPQAA